MLENVSRDELGDLVRRMPSLAAAFSSILDRAERAGRLPATISVRVDAAAEQALRRVFSPRMVSSTRDGRVRLELRAFLKATGRADHELAEELYRALGRTRRDPAAEDRLLRAKLEQALAALLPRAETAGSRAFVGAHLRGLAAPRSEISELAARVGAARALDLVRGVVRSMDALGSVRDPIRLQNFAARVLGSSKALNSGSDLYRWLGSALVDHDPHTRRALDEQGVPPHRATEIARALEVNGVYHDEAAASVLCFGGLVYEKRGRSFDHVARHSELGESSRLIVQQLRGAEFERPAARRVTVFENLTPYLDYVDACVERSITDEIVLCSSGHASWAVVALLSGLAPLGLPVRHSGDLDRAGVQILRSLKRRSGARVEPLFMDAATHRRFAERGQPLEPDERRRLEQLLRADSAANPCHDLLREILATGTWIEQEQFVGECLEEILV